MALKTRSPISELAVRTTSPDGNYFFGGLSQLTLKRQ